MATLGMMYPAREGLVWGQMKGCYLKSGGLHVLEGSVQHTGVSDQFFLEFSISINSKK